MRTLYSLFVFVSIFATSASAAIPPVSRRSFIRAVSICVAATLVRVDSLSSARQRWALHPEFDIETLGLESFGKSTGELLLTNGYVAEAETAERVRWALQAEIWRRIEPRQELKSPVKIAFVVAVPIDRNRYLYLNPHFRIDPVIRATPGSAERTVGKIEYLSDTGDFRVLTYWIDGAPTDPAVLLIEAR